MSIILPAFNEEKNIILSYNKIINILQDENIDFEIIYINDGSTDDTWNEIMKLNDPRCKGISFSRNFGKEAAIEAGLKTAVGDCAVIMDCDMQHPPEKIIEMLELWKQGYDVIEGIKIHRGKENPIYKFFSKVFYSTLSKVTGMNLKNTSDFKLLDRKVIDELNSLTEKKRFFRALSYWVGFKQTTIHYEVNERIEGTSKWSTYSLVKYAINNIVGFTIAPLQIIMLIGSIFLLLSIVLSFRVIIQFLLGESLEGFTTVILLLLIVGGSIMVSLGIVGMYIGKIYEEIKNRPNYIIEQIKVEISDKAKIIK